MKKYLLNSNPYLRDPATRENFLRLSAASSSAVEGIRRPFAESSDGIKAPVRKKPPPNR